MTSNSHIGPSEVIRQINANRGCPDTMRKAGNLSMVGVAELTPDGRKQEYYFALDQVLPEVMEVVRDIRATLPDGIAERGKDGKIVSGLQTMKDRIGPHIEAGEFWPAMYWAHNAVTTTLHIAAEHWFAQADRNSQTFQRINQLVGDPYKNAFGDRAIQMAVASAANQTIFISCGFQKMVADQFAGKEGRPMMPDDALEIHNNNLRLATPLTKLHYLETGNIIWLLGPEKLPGGETEAYANNNYFLYDDRALHPAGDRLVQDLQIHFPDDFSDRRIGCPGTKYIPEIWDWIGDITDKYASPALLAGQQGEIK